MQNKAQDTYNINLKRLTTRLNELKQKIKVYIFFRVATFIASLIVLGYFINAGNLLIALSGFFILLIAFGIVAGIHNKLERQKQLIENHIKVNTDELAFLKHRYVHRDDGMEMMDYEHPYLYDLDILGKASLFQYLNRCVTPPGKKKLIQWLKQPFMKKAAIMANQEACRELAGKTDFRHTFQAEGLLLNTSPTEHESLFQWLKGTYVILTKKHIPVLLTLMPALTLSSLVLLIFGILHYAFPIGLILVNLLIIRQYLNEINKNHHMLSRQAKTLERYGILLKLIENEKLESGKLRELKKSLYTEASPASKVINGLSRILNQFDTRLNLLMGFLLNALLLMDIRSLYKLEKWKKDYSGEVEKWFDVIAEIDAVNSLGTFAFNNQQHICYPHCQPEAFILQAKSTGHPLIEPHRRVDNDFMMDKLKEFTIITGANMAGKSTFLRTVGINLILAMMGSAVIAKSFTFYPIHLQSRIRINDSLFENESYFFAELKKLQHIVRKLEEGEEVFVLLDEILRGTNSRDKHAGSEKFIEKLLAYNAAGIIATHDLALGELEKSYPGQVINKCFEVEIKNDQLHFDYKLKPGVSQKLNASFLMHKMGIVN